MTQKILGKPPIPLHGRECHVWRIPLLAQDDNCGHLQQYLSADEKSRADKFLLPAPRRQYVLTRCALRVLLGGYLGRSPADITLTFNSFGKPGLPPPFAEWHFNVSHSGQQGLIAITRAGTVGVDIEQPKALKDLLGLAKMIFCPDDLLTWQTLPENSREAAFYQAWTRKEALAKALGYGLSTDIKALRVGFGSHDAQALDTAPTLGFSHPYCLTPLAAEDGYAAALAVCAQDVEISYFAFKCSNHSPSLISMSREFGEDKLMSDNFTRQG